LDADCPGHAQVHAKATTAAALGRDDKGLGPAVPNVQTERLVRADPQAGIATGAEHGVDDRGQVDRFSWLGGRKKKTWGALVALRWVQALPHTPPGFLEDRGEEGAAIDWPLVARVIRVPPGPLPACRRQDLVVEKGEFVCRQEAVDFRQALREPFPMVAGATGAVPRGPDQAVDPIPGQEQEILNAQGIKTRHPGWAGTLDTGAIASGEGEGAVTGLAHDGAETLNQRGLGAGGHAEVATIAAVGVDPKAFVVDHPGTGGAGVDAGTASGLGDMVVDTAFRAQDGNWRLWGRG
jgi:hypothetical protein